MKILLLAGILMVLTSCQTTSPEHEKIKSCSLACKSGVSEYSDDTISCSCYRHKEKNVDPKVEPTSNEAN